MKYSTFESNLLQRRMLYLRYGTDKPDKLSKPKARLSMSLIAEFLEAPKETLNWLHRKYFADQKPESNQSTKVTVRNISPEEILFLIN